MKKRMAQTLLVVCIFGLFFGKVYKEEYKNLANRQEADRLAAMKEIGGGQELGEASDMNIEEGTAGQGDEMNFLVESPKVNGMTDPFGIDTNDIFFSWEPKKAEADPLLLSQKAYQITVYQEDEQKLVWDSGVVLSDESVCIPYEGEGLLDFTEYSYEICVFDENDRFSISPKGYFFTAYINEKPFENAKMISMQPEEIVYWEGQAIYHKNFETKEEPIKRATFVASALGQYEAYLNGKRIGNTELAPGWTDFTESLIYNCYDVTALMQKNAEGKFNLSAMLGTGWWAGRNAFATYDFHQPGFICELRVEYEDGSIDSIVSDDTFAYCKDTAVRDADFFNGESVDFHKVWPAELSLALAKNEKATMTESGKEIPESKTAFLSEDFNGEYRSYYGSNVEHVEERDQYPVEAYTYSEIKKDGTTFGQVEKTAKQFNESAPLALAKGETLIVDLGQNIAGVPEISFSAKENTQLTILFAEMLNDSGQEEKGNDGPKGSLYRANYRTATTTVSITAASEERQTYAPTYFYTGFRYLSLTATEDALVYDLHGRFLGNSSEVTAFVSTDHVKLNQLISNIAYSQYNNFTLIATDCPQRDERLGWTGDLNSFAKTSMYQQNLYAFYEKWCRDVCQAQTVEGAYTDTVPMTIHTGAGNGGWAEAGILVPLEVYRMYGNERLLEENYESMQTYMQYLQTRSDFENGAAIGPGTIYGDWLSFEETDPVFLSAMWYAKDALAMRQIAQILEKNDDAKEYNKLYENIKKYVRAHYLTQELMFASGRELSQTEILFLLQNDLVDEDEKQLLLEKLAQDIEKNEYKLMTGFAGTPILLPILCDYGRSDIAYRILLGEENPSWLYSVNQGATTIWERYDSYTVENGFAGAAMNSFDHFNEGSVGQWIYEYLLGMKMNHAAEDSLRIQPYLPDKEVPIRHAEGYYDSPYGKIQISWEMDEKHEHADIHVEIPYGLQAKVILPLSQYEEMTLPGGSYDFSGTIE